MIQKQILSFEIGKAFDASVLLLSANSVFAVVTRLATPLARGAAGPSQLMQSPAPNKEKLPPEVRIAADCRPDTSCVIEGALFLTAVKQNKRI